jgi:hypothetical protein
MVGQTSVWPEAPPSTTAPCAPRRPNGFVILDRAWAARLDVRRVGGVYRIRRRDLLERLERLQCEEMGRSLHPDWSQTPVDGRARPRDTDAPMQQMHRM